ncbi:MAG: type II CAAX endopeptidase family protein [Bacillota bacterium]|nr:type II CAAX endopeptidase family protein [Bacillota bacterium]
MKEKVRVCAELAAVFIAICALAGFSDNIVKLGNTVPLKIALTILVYAAMTAIPYLICLAKKITFSELGYKKGEIKSQLFAGIGIFLVIFGLTVILPLLLGTDKSEVLSFKCTTPGRLAFYLFFDFLFVGFGEEFIFRGYFMRRLDAAFHSETAALVLSSVLFGLWHYPHNHNVLQVLTTSVIGLFYGLSLSRIKDCSLLSVSIAHGLQDSAIMLFSYFLL